MKKITNLLSMVLLMLCMGLTSCDDILGQFDNPFGPLSISVNSIDLDADEMTLTVGDVGQLIATVGPENATDKTVTWTSSKESVATVDATGKVTAIAEGTATIKAKAGSISTTCIVTVAKKAAEVIMYSFKVTNLAGDDQTNAVTSLKMSKAAAGVPAFCTMNEDERCVFFEAPAAWGQIYVWAWMNDGDGKDYLGTNWPGVTATKLGTADNGNSVWKWNVSGSVNPDNIIFSGGSEQTADLKFTNGGYYVGKEGLKATVTPEYEAEVSGGKITIKAEKLSEITAAADFWFEAEIGGKPYVAKVNIDPTTLSPETTMTLAMATVGDVITSDGTFATKGAAGEQAVLAYIGKVDNYFDRFLAIALEDADANRMNWSEALTKAGEYAAAHAITIGGTTYNTGTTGDTYYDQVADNESTSSATATALQQGWRLPSVTDWRYIFAGLCGLASPAPDAGGVNDGMVYGTDPTLRNAINTACGNEALIYDNYVYGNTGGYWSSSDHDADSSHAWYYRFCDSEFCWSANKTTTKHVRAVFAY